MEIRKALHDTNARLSANEPGESKGKKKLSEMSLEELWQLFPIFLTEHRDCWREWYLEEEALLKRALPFVKRISHIGSTAVSAIWAKPIIDILAEIPGEKSLGGCKEILLRSGYICMSQRESRLSFNKGYTQDGFAERVFHLHLRYEGDNDEMYFRDYLNEFPEAAKEYEEMKLRLWKEYEHDRDGYTEAKAEFVRRYTQRAKALYANRY